MRGDDYFKSDLIVVEFGEQADIPEGFTGTVIENQHNGDPHRISTYADGVLNGVVSEFHATDLGGEKSSEIYYSGGEKEGRETHFNPDQSVSFSTMNAFNLQYGSARQYKNRGTVFVAEDTKLLGEPTGLSIKRDENGNVYEWSFYIIDREAPIITGTTQLSLDEFMADTSYAELIEQYTL